MHFQFNVPNSKQLRGPSLHKGFALLRVELRKAPVNDHPGREYVPKATQQFEGHSHALIRSFKGRSSLVSHLPMNQGAAHPARQVVARKRCELTLAAQAVCGHLPMGFGV